MSAGIVDAPQVRVRWKTSGLCVAQAVLPGRAEWSARRPGRDAALGVMDALRNPDPNDTLARDVRSLLQLHVLDALAKGPPPDARQLAEKITTGIVEAG